MKELPVPQAYIRLGEHGPGDMHSVAGAEETARLYLEQFPTGRIHFFSEDVGMTASRAHWIMNAVDNSMPALDAYASSFFLDEGKVKDTKAVEKVIALWEEQDKPGAEKLSLIDRLNAQFTNPNSLLPRVGIFPEMMPDEEYEKASKEQKRVLGIHIEDMYSLGVLQGNLKRGLIPFKTKIQSHIDSSRIRERRIVAQITEKLQQDDTLAVIVPLGTVHTGVQHQLRQKGIPSKMVLADIDQNSPTPILYDPAHILIRKGIREGKESISELEWYQGLIGETARRILSLMLLEERDDNEDQITKISWRAALAIQSMDDVKKFQQAIRDTNYEDALWSLVHGEETPAE